MLNVHCAVLRTAVGLLARLWPFLMRQVGLALPGTTQHRACGAAELGDSRVLLDWRIFEDLANTPADCKSVAGERD
jgi:hypothetical protein